MDELPTLEPLHFFALSLDILPFKGKKGEPLSKAHLLPSTSSFFGQNPFAKVFLGWSEEGIYVDIISDSKNPKVFFPNFQQGDSVELFFDTRDLKNAPAMHRFCHHFFFLPETLEYEGDKVQCGEISRFRGEDKHELADPDLILVTTDEKWRGGYAMHIFIPKEVLFGYDPVTFPRLGFTYRINRVGKTQYLSVSAEEFPFEKHPALWATLILKQGSIKE